MNRPSIIYLIEETYEADGYGVLVPSQTTRMVYADIQSVTGSEWFEGGRNGLNPEYRMRIHNAEYHGEEIVLYGSTYYTIYRTYMDNDILELYVEKRKGNER